jgi:hypothetical protein
MNKRKVSDEVLLKLYNELNSVWKVGAEVGLCGQSVYERIVKLKDISKPPEYTEEQIQLIIKTYQNGFKKGDGILDSLVLSLGKSKANVSRKAKRLGLTNAARETADTFKNAISIRGIEWHKKNPHPRGMLGKTHSLEYRKECGIRASEWNKTASPEAKANRIKKILISRERKKTKHFRGSWKSGWHTINGKRCFFRSAWELSYALYLEDLIEQEKILKWEYEPKIFVFPDNEAPLTYKPDFKITLNNKNHVWREVKGWFNDVSQKKDYKFRKYFPNESLKLIRYDVSKKNDALGKLSIPLYKIRE